MDFRTLSIILFNAAIAACYLGLGCFVLLSKSTGLAAVPTMWRTIFGVACIVYAVFRVWRAWYNWRLDSEADELED